MLKEKSLAERMYQDPVYAEVVRLIGYGGIPLKEAWEKIDPLVQRFSKEAIQKAADDVSQKDASDVLRLTAEARKLAWQLLGPPPDHPDHAAFQSTEPFVPSWQRQPAPKEPTKEEPPNGKPKRRTRKKAS